MTSGNTSAISVVKKPMVYHGRTEKDLTEPLSYHGPESSRLHGTLQSPTRMAIRTLITRQRERWRQQTEQLLDSQVHRAFQDLPLHSNCNRERWFMERLGHRVHLRVREKVHSCGKRATRNAVPVSENVCSMAETKCGCVSEYFSSRALIFRQGQAIP